MSGAGRLVVTGPTGFIGRAILRRALAAGVKVIALTRRPAALADLAHAGLSVHAWEMGAPLPSPDCNGAAALLHLAAFVPPDLGDAGFAEECFRINALGALGTARAAASAGIGRFVHFSTGQLYRQGDKPAAEDDPIYPAARAPYYLCSKLAGEVFVEHQRLNHGLSAITLRLASVYGPGMKGAGLLPRLARRAREALPIELTGGGRYRVDLVHVDDVASAALAAATVSVTGIFNIGSGSATASLEAARIIVGALSADPGLIRVLEPTGAPEERGFSALDIDKARAALGYAPMSFAEGAAKWLSELKKAPEAV